MRRLVFGIFGVVCLAAPGWAQNDQTSELPSQLPPHTVVVPYPHSAQLAGAPTALVNSHILYLNNCRATNGCMITKGVFDDSRKNQASVAAHNGTVAALSTIANWASIKSCITNALSGFAVTVTDVDPGNVPHFEMVIGGTPSNLGLDSSVEGIAPYLCTAPGDCGGQTYIQNAITFAFANLDPTNTNLWCGVALQEAAHGWTLDHATPNTDPMTYKTYAANLSYQNGAPCGSDCLYGAGQNMTSFGVQCSGTNTNGTHVCMENNQSTQNEVTILTNLFGAATAAAPTVAITSPANNGTVPSGQDLVINATCSSGDGVKQIDFIVDDNIKSTSTASPATATIKGLTKAAHTIQVVCGTQKNASASAFASITVGDACTVDTDCASGQLCSNKMCVDGPGTAGGLGSPCTNNSDCQSNECGTDGNTSACVSDCDPSASTCPAGFSCLSAGSSGVCWAESGGGGGGCNTGNSSGGMILAACGLAALMFKRKKR
ncbi:MAG: Ig-like domain-containing protein [Kofleriaceae bacterium]